MVAEFPMQVNLYQISLLTTSPQTLALPSIVLSLTVVAPMQAPFAVTVTAVAQVFWALEKSGQKIPISKMAKAIRLFIFSELIII
jgi:hypothetical protein